MPHCIIEHSSNLILPENTSEFISNLHNKIIDRGNFNIENIKTRIYSSSIFSVGSENTDKGFVAVTLKILSGRSIDFKENLSEDLLDFFVAEFSKFNKNKKFNVTVDISEIDKETYARIDVG